MLGYKGRHFQTLWTIRATVELQRSILDHGKRAYSEKYGDGELLRYLSDDLVKADELADWGN